MKSYKNWKLINESFPGMVLGVSRPWNLGLNSNLPLEEKKKEEEDGEVMSDEDGGCCKGKKKSKKVEDKPVKKKMKDCEEDKKKKSKKYMSDDVNDFGDEEDHDVNDFDHEGEEGDDDHEGEEGDEVEGDDVEGEEGDEGDEVEGEEGEDDEVEDLDNDEADDAVKFGFMKDKKKKNENSFWEDIEKNYNVPHEDMGTDEEFFDSLNRQYGDPGVRFNGGVDRVDEDLLLSPDQQALIDSMPNPGEAGYAPVQRLGGDYGFSAYGESDESSQDFEVLSKYFSESVAHDLIKKRNRKKK